MNKGTKKNLCDLEYTKILNQYNMVMILIGTLIISVIISQIQQDTKVMIIIIAIFLITFFKRIFDKQLEEIKLRIENI